MDSSNYLNYNSPLPPWSVIAKNKHEAYDEQLYKYQDELCEKLYNKWLLIVQLLLALDADDSSSKLPEGEHGLLVDFKDELYPNLPVIGVKIASAYFTKNYVAQMENASQIRLDAKHVYNSLVMITSFTPSLFDYGESIKAEFALFKQYFKDWVTSFIKTDNAVDDWGLY